MATHLSGVVTPLGPIYSDNSENSPNSLIPLPWVLTHGLAAVTTFGFLSFLSTIWLFCFLTYQFVSWQVNGSPNDNNDHDAARATSPEPDFDVDGFLVPASRDFDGRESKQVQKRESFLQRLRKNPPNQFLVLIYNLLVADVQQSLGCLLNITWLARHGLHVEDTACWVQGWFLSTGNLASSLFICAIGFHTYLGVVKDYRLPSPIFYTIILFLWAFNYFNAILAIALTKNGAENGGLFVRAGAWCWINSAYQDLRLYLHYLWIFISLVVTAIVYLVIVFHLYVRSENGTSGGDEGPKDLSESPPSRSFELRPPATSAPTSSSMPKSLQHIPSIDSLKEKRAAITTFLLYPVIYIICTAPLVACRLASMAGNSVPLSCYCFAGAMIASTGWLDVVLYASTRRAIVFSGEKPPSQDTGLQTFTFMTGTLRTPHREFGNAVFVDGGKKNLAESGGMLVWVRTWCPRWMTFKKTDRKAGGLSRQGSIRGAAVSIRNRSSHNVGGGINLQGFGMGDNGSVFGNAIQCETTTSVTVENADGNGRTDEERRGSWYARGVRVVR
ncbi:G protein-coupled glucose receptor regulating Gpa2-domain-containing protein [Cladorrhinum sp. PSN259]|nr:G protein-coupled glucose receptor regulating Gpa2-domain-containing protein [Cladorrhinum sp. PSN259]